MIPYVGQEIKPVMRKRSAEGGRHPHAKNLSKRKVSSTVRELIMRRLSKNLRQLDVAKKAGYDVNSIIHWESGRRSPGLQNFLNLVAVLGGKVKIEWED